MQGTQEYLVTQVHLLSSHLSELRSEIRAMANQQNTEQDATNAPSQSLVAPGVARRCFSVHGESQLTSRVPHQSNAMAEVPMLMVRMDSNSDTKYEYIID